MLVTRARYVPDAAGSTLPAAEKNCGTQPASPMPNTAHAAIASGAVGASAAPSRPTAPTRAARGHVPRGAPRHRPAGRRPAGRSSWSARTRRRPTPRRSRSSRSSRAGAPCSSRRRRPRRAAARRPAGPAAGPAASTGRAPWDRACAGARSGSTRNELRSANATTTPISAATPSVTRTSTSGGDQQAAGAGGDQPTEGEEGVERRHDRPPVGALDHDRLRVLRHVHDAVEEADHGQRDEQAGRVRGQGRTGHRQRQGRPRRRSRPAGCRSGRWLVRRAASRSRPRRPGRAAAARAWLGRRRCGP